MKVFPWRRKSVITNKYGDDLKALLSMSYEPWIHEGKVRILIENAFRIKIEIFQLK